MARIAGIELPPSKRTKIGLTYIFGIGRTRALDILAKAKVDPEAKIKDLTDDRVLVLLLLATVSVACSGGDAAETATAPLWEHTSTTEGNVTTVNNTAGSQWGGDARLVEELSIGQMAPIVALAHKLNVHAIVTVFTTELVALSEQLPFDVYKSASPDIINRPLLEAMAATGKPLILSTGASTLPEIDRAIGWLKNAHNRLAVLQCVSCYPTPLKRVSFEGIPAIAAIAPGPCVQRSCSNAE